MAGRDFSAELFGPSAGRDFSAELFGAKPPPEKQSAFRQVADIPLGIAKGAVQGVRMIADAFGAGSDTSKTIKSAETYLSDLMSAQAKNDQQEISRIMKDAEDKGVLDQVKAGLKAFTIAPVDTLSSALGTAAPVIVGALGAKVLGAGALVGTGVSALTGAGMGAGAIKGSIYEETKDTLKKAGASEEEAERRAQLAQEYGGKNLDQILLGTVLGGAAAVGPLEKGAAGVLARRILGKTGVEATESVAEQAAKGALRRRAEAGLLEAAPEALQAGQEQVAQNIALQREGFDVPTFRGAFSAATMEALAGFGLGTTIGGGRPETPAAPEPAPAPKAPDLEAPRTGPLTPEEQIELERQRAAAERPKTTEELLAETGIQTGRPTTAEDIARIRDEHETAVIEGLLAQDAEMKRANELAALQREQQRQQIQLESEAEAIAGGISDVDRRVREGRIFSSVQDLIDRNIPFASTAISDINQKFGVINEAPLTEEERTRIENIMGMVNTFTNFVNLPVLAPKPVDRFAENQAMEALIKERTERGQAEPLRAAPPAPSPRIEETPVSQGVGEGAALRPTSGVEPSAAEDRERVTPAPVAPPAAAAPAAPTAVEPAAPPVAPPAPPDRVEVQNTLNTLNDGDIIVTDDGDRIPVARVVRNKAGDVTAVVTTKIGEEGYTGIDFDGLASLVTPQPYIDSTTGERKFSAPATIEKPKAAAPSKPPAPKPSAFESKIVSRQPAPDGMEVHVFTTTDGYGTGLFDADAGQYVNGSVTRFAGTDTLPKAEARAAEMLRKATPAAPAEPSVEPLGTRKEAQAFGKAIGATQPYPGELKGRVNLPAQKAAKEGNFQGVLSALEKSKNVIVAEIAKRARALGTKIVIDDDAEETYTGPSTLMRQMSIDGAKMHLEALNKIRALAPQVDALPDKAELSYAIRGETINAIDGGESAGRMYLEDIAKMGHSMFAPLPIGESKFKTKEDFKRLQKAYEDLTSEYGENALQLTSTGSAQITGVAGVYDAATDTIRVPEYTAKREEVLSHEIVHAQTVQAIASPTLRQKPIVARLNKLYEHVKKELEVRPGFSNSLRRAPYGIQSIQEFVAEGMGNPAFQFLLKKIKYENTSAWDSFVQTIANLIGVKRDTAFTELLSIYSDLTTEQKAAPKTEAPAVETPSADVAQQVKDLREQQTKLLTKSGKVPAPRSPARQKYDVLERQIAELEDRQLAVRTQKPRKRPSTIMGSPMLAGIFNKIGGLHTSLLPEFSTRFFTKRLDKKGRPVIQTRNPLVSGYGTLFNKNGKFDFGEIAEHLEAEGYLEPGSLERDYKDAGERAKELVKRALNGEEVLPIDEQIAKDNFEREASERQKALDRQEENRMIATGELQLEPEFDWSNKQFEENLGLDREFETDLEMYNLEPKDLEFLSDEELESELTDAEREQAQARRTRKAEEDAARQKAEGAAPGEDEALLTRPTAEGLKAKQEAAEKAAAEEKKAKAAEQERLRKEQQAKEEKARADETVKDFELGKSAEEQMTGMGDLFAAPPAAEKPPVGGFRRATAREVNSDNAQFVYDVGNGARLLFVPSQNGDVYVAAPGKGASLVVRTGDNRDNVIKTVDQFPDYIPENIRQIVLDYHKAVQGKTTDEEQTAVAMEMAEKIEALTAPKAEAPAAEATAEGAAPETNFLYSVEPTIKSDRLPSYKRGVENLRKRWDKGELTSDEFASRVDILARQIETAEFTRELPARARGADYIRQRLLEAKRRGELTAEAVDFAEWFILQNPKLVDDLAISIRTPKEGGVAGSYESVRRLMTLMKDNSSDYTAVHEILHHLERMMPKDVQSAIRKVWFKSLVEAQKKAKTEAEKTFFENIMEYHFGMGGNTYLKNALDAIKNGNVDKSFYQYSSPSEFWAENGSAIMGNRFLMQGSVLKKLKQWLREVAEKAKDLFGLNSKAPIIRALDSLSKGDGKFVTSTLLDETTEPKLSVTEKVTAAAQKALQKQPMPEKGLGHVSPELTNLAQPIFFPQNKTIIDRIEGMKDRFWQRLAQKTADQFRTIKEYSPTGYMQARLSKSVDGSLEGLLFHGQVFDDGGALNIKANTKGMMDILKPIGTELDSYLMWVALNRESRLPEEKRSKIPNMDKLVARRAEFAAGELNGKPRVEVYQDVLRQMNQLNKSVLDVALAKGLIDQKGYDTFSNDIYYIPFYKKMEEDGTVEGAKTASGLTSQEFSKELKGSEAPFGDLMENIVRNWSHILSASMKNAAAKTTINDAMELQAAEPNLKAGLEWRDGKVYSTKNDKPIEAKFDEDGKQLYAEGELRPELTTNAAGMAKIMVNGQPMYFKVTDELLMDSISSMGYMGPKSKFTLLMRDFKNMLQYGVTASPIFKVNNLIRDSVSALAVSDLKKSPVYNVMTGISLSKKDSPTYISALAGGAIFNFGSAYEGDQAKLIKRLLDQGVDGETILDSPDKIKKALKKTWEAYQDLGNRSEAANRLSLYQQMRDKGLSHLQASFMARDLLDFSMQGSWESFRFLTQVVPFMNARIQGLYKLGRDGINPTVRVLYNATTGKEIDANDKIRAAQFATVTSAVMLASALLYLSFKDDEDFKKRDAWDRDNFWWFKIPSLDIAFRIPKPFEVGAFGTLVERTLEQIVDEGAEGKQFGDSLWKTLWDTFSLNPTPQIFKPLVDIYANKDSFSGAPIESAGLERLSKQERKTDTTSPLAIALGGVSTLFPEKFQVSPVQMDYAIKGYFGWLGAMASMASTYAVMPFKEGEYPDARWLDRASLGLVRDLPAPQSAYVTAFYNSSKEISQAYADMRHYREMGDAEKVQELLEEKGDKIALAKFYDKTAKNIANIRKQIQLITNDKNLDGAEKKEMIERMKLIMSDLAKQAEDVRKSMKP